MVELVQKLLKPHLSYDENTHHYREVEEMRRIVATRGMEVEAIGRLAKEGHFQGNAHNTFYVTPNTLYTQWHRTAVGRQIAEFIGGMQELALEKSVIYSEVHSKYHYDYENFQSGVVVAFNRHLLTLPMDVQVDDYEKVPELVVGVIPGLATIEGIYPVDADAETRLSSLLGVLA